MYSTIPVQWNVKSAQAGPGRSLVGPALYVFSLLGLHTGHTVQLQLYSSSRWIVYAQIIHFTNGSSQANNAFTFVLLQKVGSLHTFTPVVIHQVDSLNTGRTAKVALLQRPTDNRKVVILYCSLVLFRMYKL
jgi:hypothetical protein